MPATAFLLNPAARPVGRHLQASPLFPHPIGRGETRTGMAAGCDPTSPVAALCAMLGSGQRSKGGSALPISPFSDLYRAYIACLNRRDWDQLGRYVDDEVEHNGRLLKLSGYRAMLMKDVRDIPDLRFNIQMLICEPPRVAARLAFECSPKGEFLGMGVNGRKVSFAENVFYEFKESRIASVWSVVDKTAIEAQLLR